MDTHVRWKQADPTSDLTGKVMACLVLSLEPANSKMNLAYMFLRYWSITKIVRFKCSQVNLDKYSFNSFSKEQR